MAHLKPLKQWYCDVCGKVIKKPEDGYVIWSEDDDFNVIDIKIIHQNREEGGRIVGCDRDDPRYSCSLPLDSFLGDNGKAELLAMVDPGPRFCSEYKSRITDKRMFLEFVKRVQLPYYEEARFYMKSEAGARILDGANEVNAILPRTLKAIIDACDEDEQIE